jgi:ABC-2 type transport system permease protein
MNLWQVERLRLVRTRTVWIMFGIFIFFGALGPATAQYLPDILERAGVSGDLGLPPPSPEFAMSQYISNALQIGLLAVAFIAAATLAFDSKTEIAVFYRTRATLTEILAPRYVVTTITAVTAFAAGTITAFAISAVLIGAPDPGATVLGALLIALYLAFTIALVGFFASLVANVAAAGLLAVASMILLGVAGLLPYVGDWLPSHLVGGFDALIAGGEFDYWRAIVVTITSGSLAVWASVGLMSRREA